MLKDGILVVEQYLAWQLNGQVTCNIPLTGVDGQLDKPNLINQSTGPALAPICTFQSAPAVNSQPLFFKC